MRAMRETSKDECIYSERMDEPHSPPENYFQEVFIPNVDIG